MKKHRGKRLKYGDLFQSREIAVAKKLVNEYIRNWDCLKEYEFDDLLQECLTHWYLKKNRYRSGKGASPQTFMGRVLQNRLVDIVRLRQTDKRKVNYDTLSLDDRIASDEDAETFLDMVEESDAPSEPFERETATLAKIDIAKTSRNLTERQQRLCSLILEGFNVSDASEVLGTPRTTLYDELERIREVFAKKGLAEYLD